MDKETLSNYGWIVICVLVLAVMIALATPFGQFISDAVWNTTQGLFDVNQNALNVVGMSGTYADSTGEMVYASAPGNYTLNSYYNTGTGLISQTGYAHTDLIPVVEGEKYSFTLSAGHKNGYQIIATFDSNKNFIRGYTFAQIEALENSGRAGKYENEYAYITIPEGVSYICINTLFNTDLEESQVFVFKGEYDESKLHSYTSNISGVNNLIDKSIIAFGDSITAGSKSNAESYVTHVAQANNMNIRNSAVGGSRMNHVLSAFKSADISNFDYVIVGGFINDTGMTIGELAEDGVTEFDTSTFIGSLETMIRTYEESGSTAKFGFVLTPRNGHNAMATTQRTYWDAAISVFEKYGIDYLDLYDFECEYLPGDPTHPTADDQVKLAKLVEAWMNTL